MDWETAFPGMTPEQVKARLDATSEWANTFVGKTPEEIKTALGHSRKWEDRAKENYRERNALLGILGVELGEGEKLDIDKVRKDYDATLSESQEAVRQSTVLAEATRAGVDPQKLSDSVAFNDKLKGLEYGEGFSDSVKQLITDFSADRPDLKMGGRRSGREHDGSTKEPEMDPRKLAASAYEDTNL